MTPQEAWETYCTRIAMPSVTALPRFRQFGHVERVGFVAHLTDTHALDPGIRAAAESGSPSSQAIEFAARLGVSQAALEQCYEALARLMRDETKGEARASH